MECSWRRKERKIKQDLMNLHFLARDIGQFTLLALQGSDKVKIMELWDFFPELFTEGREETEKKIQERQMAEYKAKFDDSAHRHNNSRKGGKS